MEYYVIGYILPGAITGQAHIILPLVFRDTAMAEDYALENLKQADEIVVFRLGTFYLHSILKSRERASRPVI
jgi:hypothetical protein